MFLTSTYHDMASQMGTNVPYTGMALYRLAHWRDKQHLEGRLVAQILFAPLALAALAEAVARFVLFFPTIFVVSDPALWAEGIQYAIVTTYCSSYAFLINLFTESLSQRLIEFDIQFRSMQKDTLLLEAAHTGKEKLVGTLLKMGAKPHKTHRSELTPALCPKLFGHPQLQKILPLDTYEKIYLKLKTLTHWLTLKGKVEIEGKQVGFEGTFSPWMFASIQKGFAAFRNWTNYSFIGLPKKESDLFEEIFSFAYKEHDYEAISRRIRKGLPTAVDAGWDGHGLCLGFYGGYFAISNRGERAEESSTLEVFQIKPELVTPSRIKEILSFKSTPRHRAESYYYSSLPAYLSGREKPKKDSLCKLFSKHGLPPAATGNCALSSKQGITPFFFALLMEKKPTETTLAAAERLATLFCDFASLHFVRTIKPEETFSSLKGGDILLAQLASKVELIRSRLSSNLSHGGRLLNLFG